MKLSICELKIALCAIVATRLQTCLGYVEQLSQSPKLVCIKTKSNSTTSRANLPTNFKLWKVNIKSVIDSEQRKGTV